MTLIKQVIYIILIKYLYSKLASPEKFVLTTFFNQSNIELAAAAKTLNIHHFSYDYSQDAGLLKMAKLFIII